MATTTHSYRTDLWIDHVSPLIGDDYEITPLSATAIRIKRKSDGQSLNLHASAGGLHTIRSSIGPTISYLAGPVSGGNLYYSGQSASCWGIECPQDGRGIRRIDSRVRVYRERPANVGMDETIYDCLGDLFFGIQDAIGKTRQSEIARLQRDPDYRALTDFLRSHYETVSPMKYTGFGREIRIFRAGFVNIYGERRGMNLSLSYALDVARRIASDGGIASRPLN